MRKVLAALLFLPLLAGCTQSTDHGQTMTAPAVLDPTKYVTPAIPKADATRLLADHADFVSKHPQRNANSPDHEAARQALLGYFKSFGLETYRFNFSTQRLANQADILGIKWGVDRTHWVFVGGHYDIVNNPGCEPDPVGCSHQTQGAYDDGSGTMITVHLARIFAAMNVTPYYTIAFTAYDGEELGIQGARAIVEAVQEGNLTVAGIQPTIVGDLDIDMVGINWPGTMAPINIISNSQKATQLTVARAKELGFPDDQIAVKANVQGGSSDYAAFWGIDSPQTVPTVFLISDFNELGLPAPAPDAAATPPTSQGLYPFWHREDTLATMSAIAGGDANLHAGFQSAGDLTAGIVHFLAYQPTVKLDAVKR